MYNTTNQLLNNQYKQTDSTTIDDNRENYLITKIPEGNASISDPSLFRLSRFLRIGATL